MRFTAARRLGTALRAIGLAFAVLVGFFALFAPAFALDGVAPGTLIAATPAPGPAASPAPTADPAPAATPGPDFARGGPLRFTMSGALMLGATEQSQSHGDPSSGLTTFNQSTTRENAGVQLGLMRRTPTTTLEFTLPMGVSVGQTSTMGLVNAGYYTTRYGFVFGAQPFALLGGVPLGQTDRGYSLVLPLRSGDVSFYRGPALGANDETLEVLGARARTVWRRTLVELGIDEASGPRGGRMRALVAGAAKSTGNLSQSLESAIESVHGGDGSDSGAFSYQYRADYGSDATYGSLTTRRITNGFLSLGSGQLQDDSFASGSIRYASGSNAIDLTESFENAGLGDSLTRSRRGSLGLSHLFERSGIQTSATLTEDREQQPAGSYWTGGASLQTGFTFDDITAVAGAQFQRAALSYGQPQALITLNGSLQRQFGTLLASASWLRTRLTGVQPGLQASGVYSISRSFGGTALALAATTTQSITPNDAIKQLAPTITVSRRISPSATLAVTYGEQRTHDLINPANNGSNRIFNVQIAAPFAIGSGVVQGRPDSRLPATIAGTVVNDTSGNQLTFASALNNGVGNVVVVLDDKEEQRTDLSGRYQFNFVTPGVHQIRLESSSLPRGVTVDQPYASVSVQGGQMAEVAFRIGTYGAVAGHIMSHDSSGTEVPLDGVSLQLDGIAFAKTDPFGAYSFGRLSAGKHTVAIVDSSLPASVIFAKSEESRQVSVQNGAVTQADFTANPLGSIAGFVAFSPVLAPQYSGPVNNAYVVANPGDYAAITNDDGSFLLDNLPAGTYTIDVDPETVPPNTGTADGPLTVTIGPDEHKENVRLTVDRKMKNVVFSLKESDVAHATIQISEPVLPPGGAAQVDVDATDARAVSATFGGKKYAFVYDRDRKVWTATIVVPSDATEGKIPVFATVTGKTASSNTEVSADVQIQPGLPLVSFKLAPARPAIGQYATVRARFLADVHPGDEIRWLDGQITKLARPITGRVYLFSVKISERPMRGALLTRQGHLPIMLR